VLVLPTIGLAASFAGAWQQSPNKPNAKMQRVWFRGLAGLNPARPSSHIWFAVCPAVPLSELAATLPRDAAPISTPPGRRCWLSRQRYWFDMNAVSPIMGSQQLWMQLEAKPENCGSFGMPGLTRFLPVATAQKRECVPVSANVTSGFTLVELLVVISVIAILVALLLPVLSRTKAAGLSAACKSNLHQLGIGLALYTTQIQKYPTWDPVGADPGTGDWAFVLVPFVNRNTKIFLCPAKKPLTVWTNIHSISPTYGYNALGSGLDIRPTGLTGVWGFSETPQGAGGHLWVGVPEARVLAPSDMIAIGDYIETPYQDGDIAGALDEQDDYIATRHGGGGNVVFCDAHVEYGKQTNWMVEATAPRQRWNNDHQPHPETWH